MLSLDFPLPLHLHSLIPPKKLISLHLSCNLASLPSLEHCPNIPVSYPCFIPRIHDRSCRLLVFLLALAQKRRPATKRSRRVTDVNRGSNVLRFCNKLILTGVGYQTPAQPLTWRARGSHFVWVALKGVQDSSRHGSRGH